MVIDGWDMVINKQEAVFP